MKRILVFSMASILALYIMVEIWIAVDTKKIIREAMDAGGSHPSVSEAAYHELNPLMSGRVTKSYRYDPKLHHMGLVKPIHWFWGAKVWVAHAYSDGSYGFREPLTLELSLKKGRWYLAAATVKP